MIKHIDLFSIRTTIIMKLRKARNMRNIQEKKSKCGHNCDQKKINKVFISKY